MAIGHFVMAFEPMFYFALATIALGNGLFLPSLPSQINDLYAADDPRRGRAYNVYYVGLNVGGLLAPLVCGTLGELYGWHNGFGAAGVRSEEHTSELQSLMRISYDVFCLKKKKEQ